MPNETTTVILTPEDVKLFEEFNKHYQSINILLKSGALKLTYGKVILNFNDGLLMGVTKEESLYRRTTK